METNPNIINFSSSSSPINNPSKPLTTCPTTLPNQPIVDEFWKKFPVGYRFCPQDGELILHYLKKKVLNQSLPPNKIVQVNIYHHNPEDLAAESYKAYKENGAYYFFTPRDRKYRNGDRPSRAAGCGYWKATGANKPVYHEYKRVGSRNALVFYRGKPPHGNKTDWIMHEFKVDNPPPTKRNGINDMRLDDWVLCKIYYKPSRSCKAQNAEEEEGDPQRTPCDENVPQLTTETQSGGDVMISSNEEVQASNGMNKKESESVFEEDHSWSYINPDNSGFGWQQEDWINNANIYNNPYMNIDDFRPPLFK